MIRTFRPWTHTSDDSYIYQLSLVLATAIVSYASVSYITYGFLCLSLRKSGEVSNFMLIRYVGAILQRGPRLCLGFAFGFRMDNPSVLNTIAVPNPGPILARPTFNPESVSYTHLRAHETRHDLVCRLLLEKKNRRPLLHERCFSP